MCSMMEAALELLQDGKPVRLLLDGLPTEDLKILQGLNLLTSKPVLYVCNVAEGDAASGNAHSEAVEAKMAADQGAGTVVISAQIEEEIAQLPDSGAARISGNERLQEAGLDRLIAAGYKLLDLITYFTAGPKETRAWTVQQGREGSTGRGCHPHRFRARLHPRPDHRL